MNFRVELSYGAAAEALDAFEAMSIKSPAAAERWRTGLEVLIASLSHMPRRYPAAREQDHTTYELRQVIHAPYRIVYTVTGDLVFILHVRHAARDDMSKEELGR